MGGCEACGTALQLSNCINEPVSVPGSLLYTGLSLRFQVAGYLLLVAGEVASSHGAPSHHPRPPPPRRF